MPLYKSISILYKLHELKKRKLSDIADILNCDRQTVTRRLHKYGVRIIKPLRPRKYITIKVNKVAKNIPCVICGWNESTRDIHHIVPVKDGGADDISNLTVLCPNCHRVVHNNPKTHIKLKTIETIIEEREAC